MHFPTHQGLKILLAIALIGLGMYVVNHLRKPLPEPIPQPPSELLVEVPRKTLGWEDERFTKDDQPFTGVALDAYPDGKPKQRFPLRNGKYHGLTEEWYPSGQPSAATHWEDGLRHGENTYWNPDGTVQKKQLWARGKMLKEEHPSPP